MRCYVVMGVSGCGKSSVGQGLAERCLMTFMDGDDLHPQANIDKMSSGQPLTDDDREPWLNLVGKALAETPGPVVIACSALKRKYRDIIRSHLSEPVQFLHLHASQEVLLARVNEREGHFMPPSLLQSQFDALEPLGPNEAGTVIDIAQDLPAVIEQTERYVREITA